LYFLLALAVGVGVVVVAAVLMGVAVLASAVVVAMVVVAAPAGVVATQVAGVATPGVPASTVAASMARHTCTAVITTTSGTGTRTMAGITAGASRGGPTGPAVAGAAGSFPLSEVRT
jgi:hypothetical protein